LNKEFGTVALTSVSGNVAAARERLAFADRNMSTARDLATKAVSGQQSGLVDAVRAAESALGQARALLDAVDSAASDIKHAVATLPSVIADIQAGIQHANEQLQAPNSKISHAGDLIAARDAAARALDGSRGAADPLGAFARLTKADADLNRLLASLAEERANAEQLNRSFEQALFTAQSRVRAVSEYVDTRRGSVGPEARTRLAEAQRQLQAAQDKKSANLTEAMGHANAASTLAATAQSLANTDVQAAQRNYTGRGGGNDLGAMIGGIIVGDLLRGGMRGGFGGWSPTSFGGSSGSSGGSSGGGYMGGGGRF
jgi:chromosome segregation ATPase